MYTFLETLNIALREVNEVPLTETTFATTRGLQQFAKESVNRAYFDISNQSSKWPWLQTPRANSPETEIRELAPEIQWYDIGSELDVKLEADWNTFLLMDVDPDVSTPETADNLKYITYDTWVRDHRVQDKLKKNEGKPEFIIRHPSGKFGITPIPNKAYWLEYNVSSSAVRFIQYGEVIPFPEEFHPVLIARVKYYLWLFRENTEQAKFSQGEYNEGLATMKRVLLSNKQERMRAV